MRFGLSTPQQDTCWPELREAWLVADAHPVVESAWLFDHFQPIFSDPGGPCLEGWSLLAALAALTTRVRLGVLVTGNVFRHPAVLAQMAATVDVVSEGRLELGLGAGWNQAECDALGIELPPWPERLERLDEACAVVRALLTDDVASYDGRHYQLREARCEPRPVQRPRPPLHVGGSGERRTLRTVARYADVWNWSGSETDELRHKLAVLDRHCEEVGRERSEIEVSALLSLGADGVDGLRRRTDELAREGVQLVIVSAPRPLGARTLEPLLLALA